MRAYAIVMLVAVTAATAPAASALVVCKGRKPVLALRDRCKKGEQQVDPATLDGLKGDPGAPGPAVHVVDKDGQDVGLVVEFGEPTVIVLRQINGEFFTLGVTGSGFVVPRLELDFFVHTDPACQSQPYLHPSGIIGLAHTVKNSIDGRTGFYALSSEQQPVTSQAYAIFVTAGIDDMEARSGCAPPRQIVKDVHDCLDPNPPTVKCVWCCTPISAGIISPVHTLDLSSLGLKPPFTLKRQ